MLIYLGAGLYLMFTVALSARGFKSLHGPCFCLPSGVWVSLSISLQRESLYVAMFSAIIHCYYTGALLVCSKVWGEG